MKISGMARSAHCQAREVRGKGRVTLSQQPELLGEPGARFHDSYQVHICVLLMLKANQIWSIRSTRGDATSLFPECCRVISVHTETCLQSQGWQSALSSDGSALCHFLLLWHHLACASTPLPKPMKWYRCNRDEREERVWFNCLCVNTRASGSCSSHNLLHAWDFQQCKAWQCGSCLELRPKTAEQMKRTGTFSLGLDGSSGWVSKHR